MRKEFGRKKFITMTHKSRLQASPGPLDLEKLFCLRKGGKCVWTLERRWQRGSGVGAFRASQASCIGICSCGPSLCKLTFFFCWNIIDLQYCISFRGTAKWLNYTYVCLYLYSFSLLFHVYLLWDIEYSSLCYIVNPVDYFIYGNLYLMWELIQYSQFILPPAPQINFLIEVEHK